MSLLIVGLCFMYFMTQTVTANQVSLKNKAAEAEPWWFNKGRAQNNLCLSKLPNMVTFALDIKYVHTVSIVKQTLLETHKARVSSLCCMFTV